MCSGHGFTLLELIVVITIIDILATRVVVNGMDVGAKAFHERTRHNIAAIARAADIERSIRGRYPENLHELLHPQEGEPRIPSGRG